MSSNKTDTIHNFFNIGVINELDSLQNDITSLNSQIEDIRSELDSKFNKNKKGESAGFIKLNFTEQDLHHLVCTKTRYQLLLKNLSKNYSETLNVKYTSNTAKIFTDELSLLSKKLTDKNKELSNKIKTYYSEKLMMYYLKYNHIFQELSKFIENVDITLSNLLCSRKYKYCRPTISDTHTDTHTNSFIHCTEIRHPIVERISPTEYITNDINLDDNNLGILLFAVNSAGKSTILRSIGIAIILAQIGYYVPCTTFNYYPFSVLISQVDMSDNLWKNISSFNYEMQGLDKILKCADKNTLVISDELCNTTEYYSGQSIVFSTIQKLLKTNTKFFFTSHLHSLGDKFYNETKLKVCHLSVLTDNSGNITFKRKFSQGNGSPLYGLEICKSIIQDKEFIDAAFTFRNTITNQNCNVLNIKKSRYNNDKIIDTCEVCNHKINNDCMIPLDTHHIKEQQFCDSNGFVENGNYHKNEIYNLVCLCKKCHKKIDTKELIINGYIQTNNGVKLDYICLPKK